ncbi:twin-arginine translocation pathway signal [uncultured Alsobacter sp.]|uniref:twin-arginine translocation pathway signal n=1 Tax=uncultured Alsobacter sp. TaxID=1748258 RepID=UPI002600A208|nr:twin-arginine translocation pathway signal [uncultured Alsobacter sp.]
MTGRIIRIDRRALVFGAAAIGAAGVLSRFAGAERAEAAAAGALAPTQTMPGGANNYIPGAPLVQNLGTGFVVSGIVRRAGDGAPMPNMRVQIWAATDRGGEREPSNRGSVVTGPDGRYRLETSPIVPNFGQPHVHIAYDDPGFATLFLRPVLNSRHDTSITADFVLMPA